MKALHGSSILPNPWVIGWMSTGLLFIFPWIHWAVTFCPHPHPGWTSAGAPPRWTAFELLQCRRRSGWIPVTLMLIGSDCQDLSWTIQITFVMMPLAVLPASCHTFRRSLAMLLMTHCGSVAMTSRRSVFVHAGRFSAWMLLGRLPKSTATGRSGRRGRRGRPAGQAETSRTPGWRSFEIPVLRNASGARRHMPAWRRRDRRRT